MDSTYGEFVFALPQDIHQLALVLVDSLDLHVEKCLRIDIDVQGLLDVRSKFSLSRKTGQD